LTDVNPAKAPSVGLYSYYVLFILFLANAFNAIDRSIVGLLVEPIKAEMNLSDASMGLLTGFAFVVFYSLFGIPIARWADRGVRRSILAMGIFVWSGMTALCGLATSFPALVLARMGVGIGEATCFPTALPLIADYFPPKRRTQAIAIFQSALYVGVVFGSIIAGAIAQAHGWRAAFIALGAPAIILALIVRFTIKEPTRGAFDPPAKPDAPAGQPSLMASLRHMFSQPAFTLLFFGAATMAVLAAILGAWGPAFFVRLHGLDLRQVGRLLGMSIGLGGVAGAVFGGYVVGYLRDRRGDERWNALIPALAALGAAPILLLFLFTPSLPVALTTAAVCSFFNSIYMGPVLAAALGLVPAQMRALAASVILIGQNLIGYGLGPFAVGVMSDALSRQMGPDGLRYALLIAPAAGLISGFILLAACRRLPSGFPTPAE